MNQVNVHSKMELGKKSTAGYKDKIGLQRQRQLRICGGRGNTKRGSRLFMQGQDEKERGTLGRFKIGERNAHQEGGIDALNA